MECNANVSVMIMYDDESVEVRYRNEANLHLSPCGCEFILVKPSRYSPLTKERVRQRTRFTTSAYKEMIIGALKFRNTYACQPYLPEELIPVDHKEPFFSIDSDVKWPELSSRVGELGRRGETIIRSEEERAVLTLAPSGEEFSVKYTCSLSSNQNHSTQPGNIKSERSPGAHQAVTALTCLSAAAAAAAAAAADDDDDDDTDEEQLEGKKRKSIQLMSDPLQPKPEAAFQSTRVVQHFSCCSVAPRWRYALSLAQRLHVTRLSEPDDVRAEESRCLSQVTVRERRSRLPRALPLTCSSPHLHRWRFTDPLLKNEHHQLPGDLVKVLWCPDATYRVLSGVVSVVEASLGDGSIIRSGGVFNSYFTHHRPEFHLGKLKVKELTYHVNNLPPDLPGQPYSVHSVVNCASRILSSYNKAKQMKFAVTPAASRVSRCAKLQDMKKVSSVQCQLSDRSSLVTAELEKIRRFNFLLDNSSLLGRQKLQEKCSEEEVTGEAVDEDIPDVLQRTSQAIRDIDALVTAAMRIFPQSEG